MSISWSGNLFVVLAGAAFAGASGGEVGIDEIHYNPTEGTDLEFIELYNPTLAPVSIEGWTLTGGIRFTFPPGATVPPLGRAAAARDPGRLIERYGIRPELGVVHGPFRGTLDDGGGRVVLADGAGETVEAVEYGDEPPWDPGADGKGGSLERVCPEALASLPWNWKSDPALGPSPLRRSHGARCPLPAPPRPPVVINEIHYQPPGEADAKLEFLELRNATGRAIDLGGWSFVHGIQYAFPEGSTMAPQGLLVICRNLAAAKTAFTLDPEVQAIGDFLGALSNSGERITLIDREGEIVDSIRYEDGGDWPAAADGLGRSLERISPDLPGDDPASWVASSPPVGDRWRKVTATGIATSSSLQIFLGSAGELLVDDIVLEDPDDPGKNLLANGSFDAGIDGWVAAGNHDDTTWDPASGPDGSGALRIVANGKGTGPANGLSFALDPPLVRNDTYTLSLRYRPVTGDRTMTARISGASATRGILIDLKTRPPVSPGAMNAIDRAIAPPFISRVTRTPREPGSEDLVAITARVRGQGPLKVRLEAWTDFKAATLDTFEMLDEGRDGDGEPGDGVFGTVLPPHPHNTAVTFRITAEDGSGASRTCPLADDPSGVLGYYVNDDRPATELPTYHILIDHATAANPVNLLRALNCSTYRSAAFAYAGDLYPGVGIRQRGQSVCGSQKPYLKLRFQHGRDFRGKHKIDLQSLWTDKSLIRERMAWDLFGEMANPACFHRFVRIHANGKYYGLHGELENPDARFLERNGLNADGNLYKAIASREEKMTDYRAGFEKKTNEDGDFSDLKTFLDAMNTVPRTGLRAFWETNVDPDVMIDYQASQVLINNSDYPHKNHYLYHDTSTGKWMPTGWDLDLCFGKLWDGTFGGVLNDRMHTPGITPWYTTRVAGEGIGNYLLDRFFYDTPDRWYQRAYRVRLWIALQEKYTSPVFDEKIADFQEDLLEEQAEDLKKWGRSAATANDPTAPRDFLPNLDRVRAHIAARRTYLINYISKTDKLAPPDLLKITEFMPAAPRGQIEFVEVWNPTGRAIDASGWMIGGIGFIFPPGSTFADGEVAVVSRSPAAFRARYGDGIRVLGPYPEPLDPAGMDLRIRDAGPGYPATIDILRYRGEPPWPEIDPEKFRSIELTEVAPERDNDSGTAWRLSTMPGGTPGWIPGLAHGVPFRRGDCNGDGRVSISDAIRLLGLFLYDFVPPRCEDGCDGNGDGTLDLSDAIVVLRYIFLGEEGIPAPGPRDCRAIAGGFCAESNCQ